MLPSSIIILVLLAAILVLALMIYLKKPQESGTKIAVLGERCSALEADKALLNDKITALSQQLVVQESEKSSLVAKLAKAESDLENERKQANEKIQLLMAAKEELSNQFKVLATTILEDSSKKFTDHNTASIDTLLKPFREKLGEFQKDVSEKFTTEGKERHTLATHIKELVELNKKLSDDATNLTKALKGEVKTQGNWGEMILERILEASGLIKGTHFDVQEYHHNAEGKKVFPDVVIHLPEERHMIIDSKVSLVAYEAYSSSDDELHKAAALKQHITSIKNHIADLSSKEYQLLHANHSPDFVILFMPLEGAFHLAISQSDVWEEAWRKNILLVSPSTLLFVMRIVSQLWDQVKQTQNALDISKRGAELYDKLTLFVEDFEKMGKQIESAQKSYTQARGRLSEGRGSAIRQAEMLRDLGVKPTKNLPKELLDVTEPEVLVNQLPLGID